MELKYRICHCWNAVSGGATDGVTCTPTVLVSVLPSASVTAKLKPPKPLLTGEARRLVVPKEGDRPVCRTEYRVDRLVRESDRKLAEVNVQIRILRTGPVRRGQPVQVSSSVRVSVTIRVGIGIGEIARRGVGVCPVKNLPPIGQAVVVGITSGVVL